jgi:hypothetical protein
LYLGGWAESEAGQREVSSKAAAQLSSTVRQQLISRSTYILALNGVHDTILGWKPKVSI